MKSLISGLCVLLNFTSAAQSPGLTINVLMDSVKADGTRYQIDMKICEPKKKTKSGNWFTHDTSKINFVALRSADIKCGEYFHEGIPRPISNEKESLFNQFKFSNQVFAWEKIFIFKISNWSSRGWWPEMYIVLPVRYKSFRTNIDITDIEFQSGKVIFLTDLKGKYDESTLSFIHSMKNDKGTEVKDFVLKKIL